MSIHVLPHLGHINPASITRTTLRKAELKYHRRAYREHWLWGKWLRPTDWTEKRFYPPTVFVYIQGAEYPLRVECESDRAAQRVRTEIDGAINAALNQTTERVVAAALRVPVEMPRGYIHDVHPLILTMPAPARHHHVMHTYTTAIDGILGRHEQGFITSTGRFVNRKEAMMLAVSSGQLKAAQAKVWPDLYSEDLW